MIIWGGLNNSSAQEVGGRYNPTTDTWSLVDYLAEPAPRIGPTAVWMGSEMIIFGGEGCFNDTWSCTPPKLLYLYLRP